MPTSSNSAARERNKQSGPSEQSCNVMEDSRSKTLYSVHGRRRNKISPYPPFLSHTSLGAAIFPATCVVVNAAVRNTGRHRIPGSPWPRARGARCRLLSERARFMRPVLIRLLCVGDV
eukprot:6214470-Pleurochrysis_carterae.AAC.5